MVALDHAPEARGTLRHRNGLPTEIAPSPRQRQIIRYTWGGLSDAEIAAHLGIGEDTVGGHLGEAYRRLGIDGRGDPRTLAAVWLWRQEYGG